MPERVIGGGRTGADLAVFPWIHECGRCPMRVQERRTRSRRTRSTLIWEIPVGMPLLTHLAAMTSPYTILVVDDEPDFVDSVRDLLRRQFKVLGTTSAVGALRLLEDHEIHVILADQR